jgi:hypothetical protein
MLKADLLTPIRPLKDLHPQFLNLISHDVYEPARGMLREVYAEFPDSDGNFVEQFQTSGFDARTFELFLFAMFKHLGHHIEREPRLDFILSRDGHEACIEAVIASPPPNDGIQPYTNDPPDRSSEELEEYRQQEAAIRLGSPLFSKLQKKYWMLPRASGKPLIFAIENFHPGALHFSDSTLSNYLFGLSSHSYHDAHGKLIITHSRSTSTSPARRRSLPAFSRSPTRRMSRPSCSATAERSRNSTGWGTRAPTTATRFG